MSGWARCRRVRRHAALLLPRHPAAQGCALPAAGRQLGAALELFVLPWQWPGLNVLPVTCKEGVVKQTPQSRASWAAGKGTRPGDRRRCAELAPPRRQQVITAPPAPRPQRRLPPAQLRTAPAAPAAPPPSPGPGMRGEGVGEGVALIRKLGGWAGEWVRRH